MMIIKEQPLITSRTGATIMRCKDKNKQSLPNTSLSIKTNQWICERTQGLSYYARGETP